MTDELTNLGDRLKSVEQFIRGKAASFCRTLTARERSNYDHDDIASELRLAVIEQDHGYDPRISKYITYVSAVVNHRLAFIKDHANTVESPPNSTGRIKEYQAEEENSRISPRRQKTANDIRRTKFGIISIDGHGGVRKGEPDESCYLLESPLAIECPPEHRTAEAERHAEAIKSAIEAVKTLRPIEAWLIGSTYGLWGQQIKTIGDLAAEGKTTPDKLSKIKSNAISKLRRQLGDRALAYLRLIER